MPYIPPASDSVNFDFTVLQWCSLSFDFTSLYSPPASSSLFFDFTVILFPLDFEFAPEVPPPITKEMLLSLGLRFHGQVYKYWVCQMSHGGQQVRRYVLVPYPGTPAQLVITSKWAAGVQAWKNLSDSDKLFWRRIGVRWNEPVTSINAFMSAWMKDKIDEIKRRYS